MGTNIIQQLESIQEGIENEGFHYFFTQHSTNACEGIPELENLQKEFISTSKKLERELHVMYAKHNIEPIW